MIRQKVYQLEQAQIKMKQEYVFCNGSPSADCFLPKANPLVLPSRYENELRVLRHELEARGVQTVSHIAGPAQHAGPSQAPPPALGHGPSNLFGGIMTNQGGSGPGLAPPPPQDQQPPQHTLQQPAPAAQPGAPPQTQSSFGGYQSGAAVNGML